MTPVGTRGTAITTAPPFNWLLDDFVRDTAGVCDAVAVAADGLLIASSSGLPRDEGDHLSALVAGLVSLAQAAARRYDFGGLRILMIEMRRGCLLVSAFADGGCLGVLAAEGADLGAVGYGMAVLVDRAGETLTPETIAQLRAARMR
ncbi:MAG: roadblock/LC7 domain-containing protein [Catenulispora sp.]|nr:roadblock/LC7 domain-containing protein [Catenulispora sp.]